MLAFIAFVRLRLVLMLLGLLAMLTTAVSAPAQTDYYWNPTAGGTGSWVTTTANWSTAFAGPLNHTWQNNGNERDNFDYAGGTVTLGTNITAYGIKFNGTNYVVAASGANVLTLPGPGVDVPPS
jgi:hypothetical protein